LERLENLEAAMSLKFSLNFTTEYLFLFGHPPLLVEGKLYPVASESG
jgi:hypothetical protein